MKSILPILDESKNEPLYLKLYKYIKKEIEEGRMMTDEKLPSIRSLSSRMDISKTTIQTAYDQLLMEGYIISREKSGYYVANIEFESRLLAREKTKLEVSTYQSEIERKISSSMYDDSSFDFLKWKKCSNYVLTYKTKELVMDTDIQGEEELRTEIARYVYQSRGVYCKSSDIVVGAGVQPITVILAIILRNMNLNIICFEDPGFVLGQNIFSDYNFNICSIEIEDDGINTSRLIKQNPDVVYVSPSHQFPTGAVMPVTKRMQLLKWADKSKYIIEDDYDSELRYYGKPVPSLKALDKNDRVIYMGSFSSTLIPSIRISYMVLPENIKHEYEKIKNNYAQGCSKIDQLIMAKFMKDGYYQKHLRRLRRLYAEKSAGITNLIKQKYAQNFKVVSNNSGLYVILELESEKKDEEIVAMVKDSGVKVVPFSRYVKGMKNVEKPLLLVYFNNVEIKKISLLIENINQIIKKEN